MSGQSSVTLAVQALSRKLDRLGLLEEQIRKLEIGDPTATSMAVLFTSDRKMSEVSSQTMLYSEADVKMKLAEFGYELSTLQYNSVYTLLQACAARARDRRAYESSKLTRAELDKLKSSIHSQNAEISEAAKKRRVQVLEELRRLGEQQQKQSREWVSIIKTNNIARKSKPCESDADFEQLGHMCEAWYEFLLQGERERVGLCVANLVDAVASTKADLEALRTARMDMPGFSKVAAATNTLETQRKAAVAEAERAVSAFITSQSPPADLSASMAALDPFGELEDESTPNISSSQLSVDAAPALMSHESATLATAQVTQRRYAAHEQLRAHTGHATQRLPLGSGAQCLGRVGTVCFMGPCVLGAGVWVGLRLTIPHRQAVPLIYSSSLTLPDEILPEVRALLRCQPEQALFAPEHAVLAADARDKSRFRASARQHAAATVIQHAFRRLARRKQALVVQTMRPVDGAGCYRAADAMASAAGPLWRDISSLAQHLLSTPASQPLVVRARLAFIWMTQHLRYIWHSEAVDADAVLAEGGGTAAGLATVYMELCAAMGVDCCVVQGVGRGSGADWRVHGGSQQHSHSWNVVKGDRDEQGRSSGPSSTRFLLVDVAYAMGEWRGLAHAHDPTSAWFDCPVSVFAQSHYPLSVRGCRRVFAALRGFMQSPTHTITHLQSVPVPMRLGQYDVEAALVPTRAMAHYGARLLYPAAAPALFVPVDRAYLCVALLVRAGVPVSASLSAFSSPYTPTSTTTTRMQLLSRHQPFTHVEMVPAHKPSHRIALVTVALPRRGAFALTLHAAPATTLPLLAMPALTLATLTLHADTGVYAYRSPHDVTVGFPRALPLPRARAQPLLLAPLTGLIDSTRPLTVSLLSAPPREQQQQRPQHGEREGRPELADVVVARGSVWTAATATSLSASSWMQRTGRTLDVAAHAPVTVFTATLPPRPLLSAVNSPAHPHALQVLGRFHGHTDYTPLYDMQMQGTGQAPGAAAAGAGEPGSPTAGVLRWASRGGAFSAGMHLLSSVTTAACVALCVRTHPHTALQAVVLPGTHSCDRTHTHTPAGSHVKVSVRLVALALGAGADGSSDDRMQHAEITDAATNALLSALADPAQVQRALDESSAPVTWQVCADVAAGDATVLLYTASSVNGVYTCVAAFHTTVPEK